MGRPFIENIFGQSKQLNLLKMHDE